MRLYSAEWVAAWNDAVGSVPASPGLAFRMLQEVRDAPEGTVRLALVAGDEGVQLVLDPPDDPPAQVTVALSYEDAASLARGELDPARLLAAGRVRVRGDLAVLIAGQALLAEVAGRLGALSERTAP